MKKILIIGGVAGGASAAARLRRHNEERLKYNILAVARKNSFVKKFVIELANNNV